MRGGSVMPVIASAREWGRAVAVIAVRLLAVSLPALSLSGAMLPSTDGINQFAPYWQAGLAVALVLALRWFAWRTIVVPSVLLTLSVAATTAVRLVRPPVEISNVIREGPSLRIVTFNAWKRNPDRAAASAWLLAQNADVIVLSEIDWSPDGIPRRLAHAYPFQADCLGDHRCSTAVLSRRRPLETEPLARGDPENRGALSAVRVRFVDRGCPVDVIGVHFNHQWPLPSYPREREELVALVRQQRNIATIVAGDLNMAPWTFTLHRLERDLGLRRAPTPATWPAGAVPLLPIDHLLLPQTWRLAAVRRGPALGSDHFPVIYNLRKGQAC